MRSRTVLLVLLFIAGLTGLLFYGFHNQQIPHQKKSEQTPSPYPSKIPVLIPTRISEGCIENTEQKKTSSPITSQKYTLKEAENYLLKGIQYTKKYQYKEALKSFEIALKVYQTEKNLEKQAIILGNIGSVYYEIADYKKAINCHDKRRKIAAPNNKKEEANSLSSLGNAYYAMGNYAQARRYYNRSRKISVNIIMDKHSEAIALGGLGSVYHSVGNYGQAIKHHEKRLNIIKEVLKNERQLTEEDRKEFLKLKGAALGSLGNAHHMQKNYERAMVYYEEHFKTAVDGQDKREEAIALGELGSAYHGYWKRSNFKNNGDLEKAIKFYEDRLIIAERIADRRLIASSHGGLGYIYYAIANLNSSPEIYTKAIKSTDKHLKTSQSIQDKPGEGKALNLLGVSYFQISNLLKKEQKFAEAQENLDKAIQNLKTAISVRESLRDKLTETEKVFIFDTQQTAYLNLQQVYISKGESKGKGEGEGEYELALEVAEKGRARAFVDVLAKQLKTNREVSTTLNFKDIKRIAQEQQATLVVYSYIAKENNISGHDSQIYIWIVRPNQEKVSFEKVPLNSWEKIFNTVREKLPIGDRPVGIIGNSLIRYIVRGTKKDINERDSNKQISQEDIEKILSEYYKVLIEPKKGHKLLSKEDKKVIFIPQGTLFEIPFAALYDTTEKKYLIEKYSILTAPSIQALDMLRERQQQREFSTKFLRDEDWLILGIEDAKPNKFCSQDVTLNKLPGAEQEAKDIASVLFQGKAMEDKTETAVRQKMLQARIIHLATHGLLDNCEEEAEVPGAIALNASGNDDGWLTASEISQMKLQAELIVLSACDTALGRLTADGVIGLSRSALAAGSSSAIVSLWNVDDYSTAFLMTEFYRQLKEQSKSGKLDKAEALRQAMLNTKNYVDKDTKKKIYSEPYQWSAFTLVGEATTQLEKRQQ